MGQPVEVRVFSTAPDIPEMLPLKGHRTGKLLIARSSDRVRADLQPVRNLIEEPAGTNEHALRTTNALLYDPPNLWREFIVF